MSFFKKLTSSKTKVNFHFYIFIASMTNLPFTLEGASLLAQFKRKDKSDQTKYATVAGREVKWQQSMYFETSLWCKNQGKPDATFDEKPFTIKIKSLTSDKDLLDFDLDLSKFAQENKFNEMQHTIVLPTDLNFDDDAGVQYAHASATSSNVRLNLVIRSYSEGLNHSRGKDFSQFHDSNSSFLNPLNSTVSVVVNDTNPVEPHEDDSPTNFNKQRPGTRKISVMFNDATANGHRQSCLPDGGAQPRDKQQRQSTYRFSIAAGKGLQAPKDSDDSDSDDGISYQTGVQFEKNTFDDEEDPFESLGRDKSKRKNRLLSTHGGHTGGGGGGGGENFSIGEDSDYE